MPSICQWQANNMERVQSSQISSRTVKQVESGCVRTADVPTVMPERTSSNPSGGGFVREVLILGIFTARSDQVQPCRLQ